MSADSDPIDAAKQQAAAADCPLSPREQTRNIILYSANWGLIYLASPVGYLGVHAPLLKHHHYADWVCNLPASVYLWGGFLPVVVLWYFPQVRLLKPLIVSGFCAMALIAALMAVVVVQLGPAWVLAGLVAHAAVLQVANGVLWTCLWEVLGRGVAESRRGQALGLAFGFGPMLAVVASLGMQLVLGSIAPAIKAIVDFPTLEYPWNFAVIFLANVPALGLAAILSGGFVVPRPKVEVRREPFVTGIFGGIGRFFGYRLLVLATAGYILVYSGHQVLTNMVLYTQEAVGEEPAKYAGLQLALRFGFKVVAGFCFGWLLVKTNPRALMVVTAGVVFAAVTWALVAPGAWFLISFGLMGAGELFGVYYPNYILGCSPRSQMRRNMAFANLFSLVAGVAPLFYGGISDLLGIEDKAFGYRMSFVASMAILAATIGMVLIALPARPRPPEEVGA
jgi:hypothetical protein